MRSLIEREDEATDRVLLQLVAILGEVATDPGRIGPTLVDRVTSLGGGPARVSATWGTSCARAHQAAIDLAANLVHYESALRAVVQDTLVEEVDSDLRIFCHRSAIDSFVTLGAQADRSVATLDAYRHQTPFDILLKVGALRPSGYGRIPEAILLAPRFSRMIQVTWVDESDDLELTAEHWPTLGFDAAHHWRTDTISMECGHTACGAAATGMDFSNEEDVDLQIDSRVKRIRGDVVPGVALALAGKKSIACRPGSAVAVFRPGDAAVSMMDAAEVQEGDVLLHFDHLSIDFGDLAFSDDPAIRRWRELLTDTYHLNRQRLLADLRNAGLNLRHLDGAVRLWMNNCRPQQKRNFEIVGGVIGMDNQDIRAAWRAISERHGAAIQHGLVGSSLAAEALIRELNVHDKLESLGQFASTNISDGFLVTEVAGSRVELRAFAVEAVERSIPVLERNLGRISDDSADVA